MYKKEGLPNLRDASSVYCFGFAGLDHGWFRLEMHKNEKEGVALPREASSVYYLGVARLDPRLFPIGDVKKGLRPSLEASFANSRGCAGLDHGWFRLEMYKRRSSPIPREASFVYPG